MNLKNGIPASKGIAIGKALIYTYEIKIDTVRFNKLNSEESIKIFQKTILDAIEYIEGLIKIAEREIGHKEAEIFDAQILMLEDEDYQDLIIQKLKNGERLDQAILHVTDIFIKKFEEMENEYFRERANDIKDVGNQLLQALSGTRPTILSNLEEDVIVIAKELTPSDTAEMNKKRILGFVTELGGSTSHVAIIAKSLNVPAVVGAKNLLKQVQNNDQIILDGIKGDIIINPDEKTLLKFKTLQKSLVDEEQEYRRVSNKIAITQDGYIISVNSNVGTIEEIENSLNSGADGIGLFRTEFLYLNRKTLPDEDEQYKAFKTILSKMGDKPVIVRTLDIGGDKNIPGLNLPKENNPFLGLRGSRFIIENSLKEILRLQIRAALRASSFGTLKLMFPMVSILEEVYELKGLVKQCKMELEAEGISIPRNVEIGIMVEVPSTAICAEIFAPHIDFFSIGTNDLTQYLLAADRTNERVATIYDHYHPSVFRLIEVVVIAAKKYGKDVGICGELASESLATPILIGLGVNELSMSPNSIPQVKWNINGLSLEKCKEDAKTVLGLSSASEVRKFLSAKI